MKEINKTYPKYFNSFDDARKYAIVNAAIYKESIEVKKINDSWAVMIPKEDEDLHTESEVYDFHDYQTAQMFALICQREFGIEVSVESEFGRGYSVLAPEGCDELVFESIMQEIEIAMEEREIREEYTSYLQELEDDDIDEIDNKNKFE